MRTFCRSAAFDVVINLFTSFGYFEDPEEDHRVVKNVYDSLKPGGVFLIDIMGKEVLARIYSETNWYEESGVLILQDRKLSSDWGWIENRWIIIENGKRSDFKISHRLYSAVELSSLLTGCGLRQIDVYSDFEGNPYDHTARRLVMVARK